jgi:hypothetical protein
MEDDKGKVEGWGMKEHVCIARSRCSGWHQLRKRSPRKKIADQKEQ